MNKEFSLSDIKEIKRIIKDFWKQMKKTGTYKVDSRKDPDTGMNICNDRIVHGYGLQGLNDSLKKEYRNYYKALHSKKFDCFILPTKVQFYRFVLQQMMPDRFSNQLWSDIKDYYWNKAEKGEIK